MSGAYLDSDTLDCEYLGRLLQLPTVPTGHMVEQPADYLWSVEKLDGVL